MGLGFPCAAASGGRGSAPSVAPGSQRQTLLVKVGRQDGVGPGFLQDV